jgi:hypothetical protein
MGRRLISDWVYGGLLYGILLLLCTPIPGRDWPSSILAIFLRFTGNLGQRYQKDDGGHLGLFVNRTLGQVKQFLTPPAAFIIHIPEVWGVCVMRWGRNSSLKLRV